MRAKSGVLAFAVIAVAMLQSAASAGYCGAARYNRCCKPKCCHTVMKTVRCVKYEKECVTCYRTVYDRVCYDKVINCTRMVPETRTKEICYTVCKPVWETKTREYTVCKPCWETKTREVSFSVC
jgi:hypothetical protein